MPSKPDRIAAELLTLMRQWAGGPLSDHEFDRLARAVFAAQFEACAPFRDFCVRRERTPPTVGHWTEIPAVPTAAFREVELRSDDAPPERVFETSGTTRSQPGRHVLSARGVELYRASMIPTFGQALLPELEAAEARTGLLPVALAPSSEVAPHSSLSFMIDGVCAALCSLPVRHVFGPRGLDLEGLRRSLVESERDGKPLLLLGTSLAFLAACEALAGRGEVFYLPDGSRVMETGGSKGRETEIRPEELRAAISSRLGVPESAIVNEYGMTEAGSQFYDDTRDDRRLKHGPPWARAVVCDPETLEPAARGRSGVVRLVDLANRFTMSFLQTEDLAESAEAGANGPGSAGFLLRGRARDAEARGCSLAAEEWTRALGGARR